MNRLKEPSTYAGLGLIANGIADCLAHNYQSGMANIVTGLFAVFVRERANASS